jgi:CTP:phosphocholine cytidylyltransferase-like protein
MRFRRLGDWISKPLLAVVPALLTEGEIKALWDAGIDALVVSLTAENQADFKALRNTLDETALTTKRKWMKARAIVPVVRQEEAKPEPDEGGDGDDE